MLHCSFITLHRSFLLQQFSKLHMYLVMGHYWVVQTCHNNLYQLPSIAVLLMYNYNFFVLQVSYRCYFNYMVLGFWVFSFQVPENLTTKGNQWKPGNYFAFLLMWFKSGAMKLIKISAVLCNHHVCYRYHCVI